MSKPKRYNADSEGAIYDRLEVTCLNLSDYIDAVGARLAEDQLIASSDLVLLVLRCFFGEGLDFAGPNSTPHLNGKEIKRPRLGESPDIVDDAYTVLRLLHAVRSQPADRHRLVQDAYKLGRMTERLAIRWEGHEAAVNSRQKQTAGLPKKLKISIDKENLRTEWNRAKRMKPHADKKTQREVVADRLSVSESTIKRRMMEFGIK